LTKGQAHDSPQGQPLVEGISAEAVLGDKASDSDAFLEYLQGRGILAVIPPSRNRKELRESETHRYKERHLVECFINKIKHFRRVFSRFEKLVKRYLAFIQFAATLIWLREGENVNRT
jgi:transposase